MKVVGINQQSQYLMDVMKLAAANTAPLGFLPKGAFVQAARQERLLVALDDHEELLGYLLFGIAQKKMLAYIVHLCVRTEHRQNKVATHLVQILKEITSRAFRGIRVHCRRDFEANKIWPNFGFTAVGETPGRSKKGSSLTIWWFDHGHPNLFSLIADQITNRKACMDASVFFQLQEPLSPANQEAHFLLADWLRENTELCVTDEIFNEINRHHDKAARQSNRGYARKFPLLSGSDDRFQQCCAELRSLFPPTLDESDKSDIRHLARSISAGADFFITRDQFLLDNTEEIFRRFGIRTIRPADLIIYQDSLIRESEYQPVRLAGSPLKVERVAALQEPYLESVFRAPHTEKKHEFANLLRSNLADPRVSNVQVIRYDEKPLALTAVRLPPGSQMEVPIIRLSAAISSGLRSTLARHLLQNLIVSAVNSQTSLVRITDPHLPLSIIDALRQNGFFNSEGVWLRINEVGMITAQQLTADLKAWGKDIPMAQQHVQGLLNAISTATSSGSSKLLLEVEKVLWPVKIRDIKIPTFIIPIRPEWAMHLFDAGVGAQDLFGGDPSLIFTVENVYYRASRPGILSAPARILWYVSKGSGKYQGTECIRACSYLEEVGIDKPKTLFAQFRRLGVYQWEDLLRLTKGDHAKEIMAFRFSSTELLRNPIPKGTLERIWKQELRKNFHIQSPLKISNDLFVRLYSS